jgi:hypothetical protein
MSAVVSKHFRELLGALNDAAWGLLEAHVDLIVGIDQESGSRLQRVLSDPLTEMNGFAALPPAGERVPVVHVRHGRENDDREIVRLTLVLLGRDSDQKPYGTAWRFESPEGPGAHCYYHCQPVRQVRSAVQIAALQRLPAWFPDDSPTIPVNAADAYELLVSMLVAVYGHDGFDDLQQQYFSGLLAARLAELDAT